MLIDVKDEILSGKPAYTIRDNSGNVLNDNVDISLKTPITQEGTPINRALFRNLQGDLYTQDRYNFPNTNYGVVAENVKFSKNIFPTSWVQPDTSNYTEYTSSGYKLTVSGVRDTTTYVATNAFDGNITTSWDSELGKEAWLKVELPEPIKILSFKIIIGVSNTAYFSNCIIQGSNNDNDWVDLYTTNSIISVLTTVTLTNPDYYKYYRVISNSTADVYHHVSELQVYEYFGKQYGYVLNLDVPLTSYELGKIVNIEGGRIPNPNGYEYIQEDIIPKSWTQVTSGTEYVSSDGTRLIANSVYSSDIKASYVCDGNTSNYWRSSVSKNPWIKIKFPSEKKITKMKIYCTSDADISLLNSIKIQGSKDDSTWVDLYTTTHYILSLTEVELKNIDFYKYYRIIYDWSTYGSAKVYEWQVSEYIQPTSYITTFNKPSLNINNLGANQINGTIIYGEKYSLVYNGTSWDIINTQIVQGSFSISKTIKTINLGFTPKLVIIYSEQNNGGNISTNNGTAREYSVPKILTSEYNNTDYSNIVDNGFTFRGSVTYVSTAYYIAIR